MVALGDSIEVKVEDASVAGIGAALSDAIITEALKRGEKATGEIAEVLDVTKLQDILNEG